MAADGYSLLDLFCGMGGFSYGFKQAGYRILGYDVNPWAVETFRLNIGDAVQRNLLELDVSDIPWTPVVLAGPPCEPFSPLNLARRGEAHPLYPCIFRAFEIIGVKQPEIFVLENVPNALRHGRVVEALNRLAGYDMAVRTVCYADYGAATSRRRSFVIGVREGCGVGAAEVFERIPRGVPQTVWDAIHDLRDVAWDPSIDHVWVVGRRPWSEFRNMWKIESGRYGFFALDWGRPSPSFGNVSKVYTMHPDSFNGGPARTISVREAMRIMGFPDVFRFPVDAPKQIRYEMVADAVSPVFSHAVAQAVGGLLKPHPC